MVRAPNDGEQAIRCGVAQQVEVGRDGFEKFAQAEGSRVTQ